jgi:DNA-binding LytR/AlgR family response regulator
MREEFVQVLGRRVLKALPRAEVLRLQAGDKYVTVYSATQEVLLADSLAALEREGMPGFFRCHRTHLVRLDLITRVWRAHNSTDYWLQLQGCAEPLPVSRRHRRALFALRPELNPSA